MCPTQWPIDPALYGSIIVHAWLDENDDDVWDASEPGVVVTQAVIYQGSVPVGMPLPSLQSVTNERGIDVRTDVLPGGYVIVLLRFEGCYQPDYDNYQFLTVNSGETAIIPVRFWLDWRCSTPTPAATATVTKTPTVGPTATATAIALHVCPNRWTNCMRLEPNEGCPAGTQEDTWGECQVGWHCCVPATPTVMP